MPGIRRRTLLGAASAAAGLTVLDGLLGAPAARAAGPTPHEAILRDARMEWRRLPADRHDAPFVGSGTRTALVRGGDRGNELDLVVSDGSLTEPGGRLVLVLAGAVTAVDWTLDLWNAELTGTVTTTRGALEFTVLAPAGRDLLLVDLRPSPGEASAAWRADGDGVPPWRERHDGTRRMLFAGDGADADPAALAGAHRDRWHAHYLRSFVSVPDKRWQRFLWAQLYKAGATRTAVRHGVLHPLLHTAGHGGTLDGGWTRPSGGLAVPGTGIRSGGRGSPIEAWALPELWSAYRHSMDTALLRDQLYPALTRVLAFHRQFLVEGDDGLLHLPGQDPAPLRWAANRAADGAEILGRPAPDAARWRDVAARLAPYRPEPPGRDPEDWTGRHHAAAVPAAAAGEACTHLGRLVTGPWLTANTRYAEHGRSLDPVAYTAAGALLDVLVRAGERPGTGTVLEVFPAVGAGWRDVSVTGLRTEGAFVLDASRANGRTEWVRLRGATGAPVVVRHGIEGPAEVRTGGTTRPVGQQVRMRLAPGDTALLTRAGAPEPDPSPRDVAPDGSAARWGLAGAV